MEDHICREVREGRGRKYATDEGFGRECDGQNIWEVHA